MQGIRGGDVNTRARTTFLSKSRVLAVALCLGLIAGFILSSAASASTITEYTITTPSSNPSGITSGSDGNLWFTESATNKIGRMTTAGVVTEYNIPTGGSGPYGITLGPDGNLWFTENAAYKIGRLTTAGVFTEFGPTTGTPYRITSGPDGNLWFTEWTSNKIGCITTAGVITEYATPGSWPSGITSGPDGNLWFTELLTNKIVKMTTGGAMTEYAAAGLPNGIAAGSDGNLWFTEYTGNKIGKITTAGVVTEYTVPTSGSVPVRITSGPDGNLWFTENAVSANKIGRITTGGTFTEFAVPTASSNPFDITTGPDGNIWFTESAAAANKIGSLKDETQVLTGNPDAALALTAPSDNTGMAFTVGSDNADEDSDADNLVNCKSNVTYTVEINCDVTGNKTAAFMWEWNGSSYVADGKKLQTAMSMREHSGGTYGAITGTSTAISGFTGMAPTPDAGINTYVDYEQPVNYGDQRLSSTSYRHLLTYTIVQNV